MTYELFTMENLPNAGGKRIISAIQKAVARYFGVRKRDLIGKLDKADLRNYRHAAVFLARELTDPEVTSNGDIAQMFGLAHKTSTTYSCNRITGAGPTTQKVVATVRKEVKAALQALKQEGEKKTKKKKKKKKK